MAKKQIYLTWDAYRAGFIATATALEKLVEQENIHIHQVYYLHNERLTDKNHAGWEAFSDKKVAPEIQSRYQENATFLDEVKRCAVIGKDYPRKNIKMETKRLDIKSVTDYQSIYNRVRGFLEEYIAPISDGDLHINVSPGTPQMHVVWLMLNTAGYLPPTTRLWASQWDKKKKQIVLTAIQFKPKTFLSEVLASRFNKSQRIRINPNDTRSPKRKEAENLLRLYTTLPKAPILILGERGTGKSTYVKTLIQEQYGQSDFPIEEIACGTLSEELMRSELFGHAQGAFTGANSEKQGLLAKFKDEGILFLDEIHDLSKPLQRQLIQVLQSGEYYPVGSETKQTTNPRIIVASNYSYEQLSYEILDADFFDRVARFVVAIPPLRDCKEDLEHYWRKTWQQLSNFEAAPALIWNEQIRQYLHQAELNGNFRDLQKLVSYLMAFYLREKNAQRAFQLAKAQYEKWPSKPLTIAPASQNPYYIQGSSYKTILTQFNHDLACWAEQYYGSKEAAAHVLERGTSTLYQDIQKGQEKGDTNL
ncbi:MAG: sigma-54-dependent transcriptional regulator [Aureispira sp.]